MLHGVRQLESAMHSVRGRNPWFEVLEGLLSDLEIENDDGNTLVDVIEVLPDLESETDSCVGRGEV